MRSILIKMLLFVLELLMDKIYECASGFRKLMKVKYRINPQELISAILDENITDTVLDKSQKYKSETLYEGGSIEERISEMRYLESVRNLIIM